MNFQFGEKNKVPPFLRLFLLGLLGSPDHFASITIPSSWTCFDRRILKRSSGYGNLASTLKQKK